MKLAIVGAGPAGLIAARNALKIGIDVVVFEKLTRIGGIWNPDSGGAYSNAKMQNSRHSFHYMSVPAIDSEAFPNVRQVNDYLSEMAEKEGVLNITFLNTVVTNLARSGKGWLLTSEQSGVYDQTLFDRVIITTGELWQPRQLSVPGLSHFTGKLVTSRDYRHPEIFRGARVLVVGGGVSGADIASDLVPFASSVSLSVKKLGLFLPRNFPSGPNDMQHSYLGRYLLNTLSYDQYLAYLDELLPDYMRMYRASGVLPERANNNAVHVNEKIIPNIASGCIKIKPHLERFNNKGQVEFVDASVGEYDVIVSCIGYEMPDYSFVKGLRRERLYEHFFWADDPTLSVINPPVDTAGFGAAFPYFDIISQWILKVFTGQTSLPIRPEIDTWCTEHMQTLHVKRFYDSWLETIRIGLLSGILPEPNVDFTTYWNLISSVVKPAYLINPPSTPVPGAKDYIFSLNEARIRLLAGLSITARQHLLLSGQISEEEKKATSQITPKDIIPVWLPYSQNYL